MQEVIDSTGGPGTAPACDRVVAAEAGAARIVQLKSGRPSPCLFLIPGTGGRIEGFADLAHLIETPMPIYAIEARGVDDASEPDYDIDTMVIHYLERIKAVQPAGPYFLAGHSFGGMVVYEMAQRLVEAKQPVGCLILLDTVVPWRHWPLRFLIANLASRLRDHAHRLASNSIKTSFYYYFRRILLRLHGMQHIPADLKFGKDAARMLLANDMILKKWKPKFYPGKLTLFGTSDMKELAFVWRHRVRELESHIAEGGHLGLIEWPNVKSLAASISACLAKAG